MAEKIIFFTQGAAVTESENEQIEAINATCVKPFDLLVQNSQVAQNLGDDADGPILAQCDYVAGAVPSEYADKDVFDPENPPNGGGTVIEDNQAVVTNGDALDIAGSAIKATVVAASGDASVTVPATSAILSQAGSVAVQNSAGASIGAGTANVAANAVTNVRLPATIAGLANSAAVTILPATGTTPAQGSATAAVASGVITGVRLTATRAVINSGLALPVDGGTVTLTVAANVVTATYTPTEE